MKKKETKHKRALKEEQSEVTQLKRDLDRVEKEKTELKKERKTAENWAKPWSETRKRLTGAKT